jgi:anaerobic selenocysteine-containing dehydrogenase
VTVKDGEAVDLRGDPQHPFTRGWLCNKVKDYLSYARSPDRLLYPMRRIGPKGAGELVRISWEEAIDTIASRLTEVIASDGPEAIWPFVGTGSMGLIQGIYGAGRRLWNVIGTSRHVVTICTIAGGFGTGYTLGDNRVGMDPETFRHSKLILLWGANVLSTHPHLWRPILEARRKGAAIVAIDPIRTRTAAASDWHLAPLPGTDGALALGLLNVVVDEGLEDKGFLDEHTLGWGAFRERVLEFPPARVATITGLPVESIVELGRRIGRSRPTGIRIGIGLQRHGGGGMAVRTITCIPGVTGDWRYAGGGVSYDTRGFFGVNWGALWRDDLRERPARALSMTRLGEGLLEVEDPRVMALFVYASNPVASVPHQTKVRRGLERDDLFTVAIEHFATDTVRYADIVLPATMQIEHEDLLIAYGHLYLAWNEPAVAPPGECLPTTEIFRRLARRMGLEEPALYESDESMARRVLESGHPSLGGITLEELKARGWIRLSYPEPFVPFATSFPTASGRLELVSKRMAQAGLDPVAGFTPGYETAESALAREYPLRLLTPADHYFLNSMFGNVPAQRDRAGAPALLIHPEDAAPRGIAAGDEVRVGNARGSFVAVADVSDRVRPGVVASPKGRWPRDSKEGSTVNATVDERDSDMGGGAVFHDNRVRVEKRVG